MEFSVLASGSKGNCTLVKTSTTAILLDAGLSGKKILTELENLNIETSIIKAVVISHDHSDHTKGAGIISRKLNIPIYLTKPTYGKIAKYIGKVNAGLFHFESGQNFNIGDICIESFKAPHDGIDGSNFVLYKQSSTEKRLAIATDLGYCTIQLKQKLLGISSLVLESNHDMEKLLKGPYPWHLKQRIKSRQGHLSNMQTLEILQSILHPQLSNIVLAHLSEENNCPKIAFENINKFLQSKNHKAKLTVAMQDCNTGLLKV